MGGGRRRRTLHGRGGMACDALLGRQDERGLLRQSLGFFGGPFLVRVGEWGGDGLLWFGNAGWLHLGFALKNSLTLPGDTASRHSDFLII